MNQSELQVIVSKHEFDKMQTELEQLRIIVESRTLTAVSSTNVSYLPVNSCFTYSGGNMIKTETKYILGLDKDAVAADLAKEIGRLNNEAYYLIERNTNQENEISFLRSEIQKLENQKWYEKLFKKDK